MIIQLFQFFNQFNCQGGEIFNFALVGSSDNVRDSSTFRLSAAVLAFLHVLGTVYISCFQLLMSDDAA